MKKLILIIRSLTRFAVPVALLLIVGSGHVWRAQAAAATLTITPTSGPPGATISFNATGLPPYAMAVVRFDGQIMETSPSFLFGSATGLLTGTFKAPTQNITDGPKMVTVEVGGVALASAAFEVSSSLAAIFIDPSAGPSGAKITVTGLNFNPSSLLTIKFDGQTMLTTPSSIVSTPTGGFIASISVPAKGNGLYAVTATDAAGKSASGTFRVNAATGRLALYPEAGVGTVLLSGRDFTGGSPVTVYFDGQRVPTIPEVPTASTGTGAGFSAVLSVPTLAPGQYQVLVIDGAAVAGTATFTVPAGVGSGAQGPAGADVPVLDKGARFPVTVLDASLNPVAGATVYLINNASGITLQMGVTSAAGLLVMTAPDVNNETWFRVESNSGSLVSPRRVMVLPGQAPAAPALRAEIALTNHNVVDGGATGPAYIGGRVVRLFDAVTGETSGITDGIGAFDAYATYGPAGITVKAASGVGSFAANTTSLLNTGGGGRTNITGFQAGAAPNPPAELFRLYPWITGSKDTAYTVTVHFNLVSRVGGGEVSQAGDVTKTFRRGDANNNGEVTITDALFIAQYLAGLRSLGEAGDQVNPVNSATPMNDSATAGSSIAIQDAMYIAQMLAGLRDASYTQI
ncbi:MAG: hypothetical protein HY673_11965 [Chloroflexi bacterium]|nr:hypothetical protein [Chloroflexota bacterium]